MSGLRADTGLGIVFFRLFRLNNFTVGIGNIAYNLSNGRNNNTTREGILYTEYRGCDGCLHLGTFKRQVAVNHLAVNNLKSPAVAKRLGAYDFTIFKGNVFAIPC